MDFHVEFDWSPLGRRQKRHHSALKRIERNIARKVDPWLEVRFPKKPTAIEVTVSCKKAHTNLVSSVAAVVIHDCFLAANLAAPGSFDLYRAKVTSHYFAPELSMSNVFFEQSLYAKNAFPTKAEFLELDLVVQWLRSVRTASTLTPHNPTEKALVALLHLSSQELSPTTIIWLFYAFESLLQTKTGENRSMLVRRIAQLLDLEAEAVILLRRQLNSLYDLRSSIVHGGLELIHPVHNEILDPRTDEKFQQLLSSADFGCTILVLCLQRLIMRGWRWPQFTEAMTGESI